MQTHIVESNTWQLAVQYFPSIPMMNFPFSTFAWISLNKLNHHIQYPPNSLRSTDVDLPSNINIIYVRTSAWTLENSRHRDALYVAL